MLPDLLLPFAEDYKIPESFQIYHLSLWRGIYDRSADLAMLRREIYCLAENPSGTRSAYSSGRSLRAIFWPRPERQPWAGC